MSGTGGVGMHKSVVLALLVSLIWCVGLQAQTTEGAIVGTVTDPSGAVISGAVVTVTNMGTGIAVKATTDASGAYVVTPLHIGHYSVSVEASGFKRSVRSDITV